MPHTRSQSVLSAILAAALGAGVIVSTEADAQGMTPKQAIDSRRANMRDIVGPRKVIEDQLKTDAPQLIELQHASAELAMHGKGMLTWFPANSGPGPGMRTKAKDTVWKDKRGFAAELKAFQVATAKLDKVAQAGNVDGVRVEIKNVMATCASCHEKFREK